MSFISAYFYDRFMKETEEACLQRWRQELLEQAHGDVLEIGAGTGASLAFYPDRVSRLVLTEPDRHMRKILQEKADGQRLKNVEIADGHADSIAADDASFDCVFASLVCCSVKSLSGSLAEIHRVLKKGGYFIFLEHVAAAEGTSRRRWQNRINPIWKTLMGNCHLNRETEQAISQAGFKLNTINKESMRKAIAIVRPTIRGVAEKL